MRIGIEKILVLLLTLMGLILGIYSKSTYTNIMEEEDILDSFETAELAGDWLSANEEILADQEYAIKCRVISGPTYSFRTFTYKVEVLEVFKGSDLNVGDEINIWRGSWSVRASEKRIDLGYINTLSTEKEYMVFLSERLDIPEEKYGVVYAMSGDIIGAPIFCYDDDFERVCAPLSTEEDYGSYVSYSLIKNNEFFASNETIMQSAYEYKYRVMSTYDSSYVAP